jgi:uncharacterized damage-inducible protein DinB
MPLLYFSRILGFCFAVCSLLNAQQFSSKMPPSVPEVSGQLNESVALRYIDIKLGEGSSAGPGKRYTVHYTGWLRDGTKFDSSVDRSEPIEFVQGRRQVIAGWEAGFEGMRAGGKRRLFIPYQLAYGEKGSGPIPPKAELIFDVELLDVKDTPEVPAAADLLLSFRDVESKVLALAKAVPEEKYSWRPSPGVRSFGEVFIHIAQANQLLFDLASKTLAGEKLTQRINDNAKNEKQALTKTQILALLEESFTTVRKALETARAGGLAAEADFFGTLTTRRGVLTSLDVHAAEHMGQAIAYARMNGITPPWSKGNAQ